MKQKRHSKKINRQLLAKATAQYFAEMDEKAVRAENQLAHGLSKSLGSADFTR